MPPKKVTESTEATQSTENKVESTSQTTVEQPKQTVRIIQNNPAIEARWTSAGHLDIICKNEQFFLANKLCMLNTGISIELPKGWYAEVKNTHQSSTGLIFTPMVVSNDKQISLNITNNSFGAKKLHNEAVAHVVFHKTPELDVQIV